MPLAAGTRLGPYEIVSPLGAGGMGEVYRAADTRLGRAVAIKVLPAEVAGDRDRLARFEREARAISALNHPHIVTLYEVGTSDAGPYLVLEKIDGRSLRDVLHDGPLPVRRILQLATQIAEGVAKAHAAGIVHRDLKPDNVMVTGDGFAKILDFGLAKLVWPELEAGSIQEATTLVKETASGLILGTLGYLSPEQASGRPADYRADQFALGALMYEMATGERPFRRATHLESLTATIRDEPEPVRSRRADLPPPFEWLIERCLAKDPSDRYASTSDLARELATLRDHLSDLSRMPAGAETPADRRLVPGAWIGWAMAAAVVMGVAVGGFVLGTRTAGPPEPSFQPLTFQRGVITGARFGPDGRTVYYSASYGPEPSRVYVTHPERIESKLVDVPPGFLLGVSSRDELAVLLTDERANYSSAGTLARVPAVGGTPRLLVDDALYGDWAPDGEQLAVVRSDGSCEFPIGRQVVDRCAMIRISPRSDHIAFLGGSPGLEVRTIEGGPVATVDMPMIFGLAWAPDGREVWFTGSESGGAHDRALYALSLSGVRRLVARIPGAMTVYDVAPDGKGALIATGAGWQGITAASADGGREQSLDLLGRTEIVGLSADGRWVLVHENREVGTGAYLRAADGTSTVRLEGRARGLSPDGAWALVHPAGNPARLALVPTRAGASREVGLEPGLQASEVEMARWSGDGRRLLMWLRPRDGDEASAMLYVRDGEGAWRAVTPALRPGPFVVSRDGQAIATRDAGGSVTIYPIDGGAPRRLEGERGRPVHWSADGRQLFLSGPGLFPARLYRRDLASGRIEPWLTLAPSDPSGVMFIGRVLVAADDRSYVYQYSRATNELYLARDLR